MIDKATTRLGQGKPSATAQGAAEGRAAHRLLDQPLVFDDWLALRILGRNGEATLRSDVDRHQSPFMRALRGQFVGRSRYAEEALAAAIGQGTLQYVVLGAGLDTYAYRNAAGRLRVFEVDHPATQQWKQDRLREVDLDAPASLSFVPVDLERQTLPDALLQAGFNAPAPAFVASLGVCNYLEKEDFYETLAWVASLAPGSEFVFDFASQPSLQSPETRAALEQLAIKLAAMGEPLRSFYGPTEIGSKAHELGFREVRVVPAAEINAKYFESIGSDLRMRGYLMHARV